jgi:hypothetical protein
VADSLSTTLVFADVGSTTFFLNMLLDNVSVSEIDEGLPTFTTQLANVATAEGRSATFSVAATGSGPLTYQWRRAGVDIPGAAESFLTLTNVSIADAGDYDVVVSNPFGMLISSAAMLTVVPPAILLNGSFEYGSAGWILSGSVATSTKPLYEFSDGAAMLHFNFGQQTPNGEISQSFSTTIGQTYQLAFDLGAFSTLVQREQRIQVIVEGESVLLSEVRTATSPGDGTDYQPHSFTFVADSTTTTLRFRDVSVQTMNVDLALDNVRIAAPATGEPGAAFASIARTSGGYMVQFHGLPGHHYDVQRSEDLKTWVTLIDVEAGPGGIGTCEDGNPPDGVAFYRTVLKSN